MQKGIVEARPWAQHHHNLRFEDGGKGEVDVAGMVDFTSFLAPSPTPVYFSPKSPSTPTSSKPP